MKDIINKIKDTNLSTLYIILAGLIGVVLIATIILISLKRKNGEIVYDKADFVHKMLIKDNSIKNQLVTAASIGFLIAFIVLFFLKVVLVALIMLGAFVLTRILRFYYRADERFDRVEYNLNELYRFGFLRKTKIIKWSELAKVGVQGLHADRKLVFTSKKGIKIKVELGREGSYEFLVFCEQKLEGKNFEAIKIAKGRR